MSFFGRPQPQPQQHQGPTLDVRVIAAHDLKNTETFGKQDPYVTLGFNEAGKGFVKTYVAQDAGVNPQWNQGFSIPVQGNDLFVELYDQETTGDDVIGFAAIPIAQLHPLPGSSINGWFQLYSTDKAKPKGEINLILTLRPAVQSGYPNEQSVKGQSYPHQAQVKRLKSKETANLAADIGIGVLGAGLAVGAGFLGKNIYDQQQKKQQEEARKKKEAEEAALRQKQEQERWEQEKKQFQTQKQTWEQEQARQRQQLQQLQQERDQYQSRYQEHSSHEERRYSGDKKKHYKKYGGDSSDSDDGGSARKWNPVGTYSAGDRVKYKGRKYLCLQGFTSNPTWAPDQAHSLWQAQ